MRIAVIGAGGVGGAFGAALAKAGADVTFVARGAHRAAIRSIVGPDTAVIPLQNGIDASERLIPILGKAAVMGGVAQISATIAEPGVIRQTGTFMRLVFGELSGRPSQR